MAEGVLAVAGVEKRYHDGGGWLSVLRGVEFSLRGGETAAIVGRSGSGKSTLLNLLGLLDRPDAGEVYIDGEATSGLSEGRRTWMRGKEIGFVFQNYHMLGDFSVVENVMLGAAVGMGGGFGRANRLRAMEWLERVGLRGRERQSPGRLSGGERQRAAIARALMAEPAVLLCDEPTGNLDAATGEEVAEWLWRVAHESGMAMVVVTHEAALAARADRVLRLEDGVLRQNSP